MRGVVVFVFIFLAMPVAFSQQFLGYWEIMNKETEDAEETEAREKWVEFFEDKTYAAGVIGSGNPSKVGNWTYDKKEKRLELFSANGNVDDGKYVIADVSDTHMTLELLWKTIYLEKSTKKIEKRVPNIETRQYWRFPFEAGYPNQHTIIDDSAFYFGSDRTTVVSLDKSTGELRWVSDAKLGDKGVFHTIAQDEDYLYFNGTQRMLYKVDKKDGKTVWSVDLPFDDDVLNKITLHNDLIFVNPLDKSFLALDKNGEEVWRTELSNPVFSYTINENRIYAHVGFGDFVVMDVTTGRIINETKMTGKVNYYPEPVIHNGTLLICDLSNESLSAYDMITLDKKWEDSLHHFKGVFKSGDMVFAISDYEFAKIVPHNGFINWGVQHNFGRICDPSVLDGKVFIQSRKEFVIIDTENGNVMYASPFDHKSFSQPIVTPDGIYLGYYGEIIKVHLPF